MAPALARQHVANCGLIDAEHPRDGSLAHLTVQGSDAENVFFCQLDSAVLLPAIAGSGSNHVGHVFGMCFPRKMVRVDATKMTVSARVGCFVARRWRSAVDAL